MFGIWHGKRKCELSADDERFRQKNESESDRIDGIGRCVDGVQARK